MTDVSDIAGTLILLLVFIALQPLFSTSIDILVPQLGETESLIARSIPLIVLLAIAVEAWKPEGSVQTVRR